MTPPLAASAKGKSARKEKLPPMPISISPNLTHEPSHDRFGDTYPGQAHVAGTGPKDVQCKDCIFWHNWKTVRTATGPQRVEDRENVIDGALCNKPIINKAAKKIPSYAAACMFFEEEDDPQ